MEINDALINSCRLKDRVAQRQLYFLLLPYLRAIATRYLRDPSYVKDVLQESYLKIFDKIDSYDSTKASFKSWAAKVVINRSINYNQRIIKEVKSALEETEKTLICFPRVLSDFSEQHLLNILKQMPSDYFFVFNLFVIEEYNHKEISDILEISEALSRKRLSRARSWIQKTFKGMTPLSDQLFSSTINLS